MHFAFVPRTVAIVTVYCCCTAAQVPPAGPSSPPQTPATHEGPGQQKPSKQVKEQEGQPPPAPPRVVPQDPAQQAWDLLETATHSDKTSERAIAVSALSLLPENARALKFVEAALLDDKAEVRAAAAVSLGDLHYKSSIPKLRSMLEDKDPGVVLAATHALDEMHDESAYEVYYEILTGERKVKEGLISKGTAFLQDPKKLAKLGIEESISNVVPFGGFGVAAYRWMSKNEGARIRASAAIALADDPDPMSTKALINAAGDTDWTVRASALEALAKRSDPSALQTVELYLYDEKSEVKYNAAAATLRLLAIEQKRHHGKKDNPRTKSSTPLTSSPANPH